MYYNLDISGSDTTIDQPIIYSVSRDITEYLNLDSIDNLKVIESDGLQKTDGDERSSAYAYLEVEYSFDEQDTDSTNKLSSYLLYGDFKLKCNYIVRELKLSLSLSGKSKTKMVSVRNKLKQIMLHRGNTHTHNIAYRYYLDNRLLVLINEMYKLRKNNGCYAGNFQEYINGLIQDDRSTMTSNQVGENPNLTFKEEQHDIVGVFEDNDMNKEVEYDKDTGLYMVKLDYSINISLPFEFLIKYSNALGSLILPLKYITIPHSKPSDKLLWLTNSINDLLKKPKELHSLESLIVNIPSVDTFSPKGIDYIMDIFSVLVNYDSNTGIMFNLKELGDVELIPEMISFLETTEFSYITTHGESVVHLYIYEDDILLDDDKMTVDSDLNVIFNGVMDTCKSYRVIFGLDIQYITSYKFNGHNPYPWFLPHIAYDPVLLSPDNTPTTGIAYTQHQTNNYDPSPYNAPGQNPNDPRDGSWIFSHLPGVNLKYEHARITAATVQVSAIIATLRKS